MLDRLAALRSGAEGLNMFAEARNLHRVGHHKLAPDSILGRHQRRNIVSGTYLTSHNTTKGDK
jgi:hypothetical protein